jgi:hypothetical protein
MKVGKQTKGNLYKNLLVMEFSVNCIVNLVNLVIIFYFRLCWVFLMPINEIDQIFVIFHVHATCIGSFVFPPGWRVGFTIYREKTRHGLNLKLRILYQNKHSKMYCRK